MHRSKVVLREPWFLTVLGILVLGGLFLLSSASVALSQKLYGSVSYVAFRQAFALLLGLAAFVTVQAIPYGFWKRAAAPLLLVALILLGIVLLPTVGVELHGARRWIDLGSLTFQPSEFAKLAVVLALAWWFSRAGSRARSLQYGMLPFLGIMGAVGALLVLEPDLGTLGVIVGAAMVVYFVAGARWVEVGTLVVCGILALLLLSYISPYRAERLMVFFVRDIDPQGIGYQVRQASIAIGSGGFWGVGYGASQQKFSRLPEPMGDSIFAVVAEEFGLLGSIGVLLLFLLLLWRGIVIARAAPDAFSKFAAIGIVSSVVLQAFINIAAISGILPLTGIPLPFISYGGTSIVITLAGLGIVYQIAKHS
ncbi:MAG: putative lipid II flippase FtsW [Candidatus Sungbacteria bacterium]|nr:putative lipid II flippase FtsW [Candidatus Sungbacteria bacterium]